MITDTNILDSYFNVDHHDDMNDAPCKMRKIQCEVWEQPYAKFLGQESKILNPRTKISVSLSTQECIPSKFSLWSFGDSFPSIEKVIPREMVESMDSVLEQYISPESIVPSINISVSEDNSEDFCSPKQFDSGLDQSLSPESTRDSINISNFDDSLSQEQYDSFLEQPLRPSTEDISNMTYSEESYSPEQYSLVPDHMDSTRASSDLLSSLPTESEDEDPKENKKRTCTSHKKGSKKDGKKGQNRMKNLPGLLMQRVKTLSKKQTKFFIQAIHKKGLFINELEDFINFIIKYNKNAKTWAAIDQFLRINVRFARGYLELVYCFLSDEYRAEFEAYLNEGRMAEKNKVLLREKKKEILRKFKELERNLDFEEYVPIEVNYDK